MIRPQDSLAMIMNPKRPERRVLALALAALAIGGLVYAAVSRQWLYNEATNVGGSYGFGPRGMEMCTDARRAHGPGPTVHVVTCETLTNGAFVERWQEQVRDQRIFISLVTGIDFGLVGEHVQPMKLHRVGKQVAIDDGAPIALDAPGVPTLPVAIARVTLVDPVTDIEITPGIADSLERAARWSGPRETLVGDAHDALTRMLEERRTSGGFVVCGWITFFACLVAAASLFIAFVLVAFKQRRSLPIMPTTTALLGLMVAIVTGCVFVATKPGSSGFIGVSFGFWGFGAGVVIGIAATLMLNRLLRPADPDLLDDAMNPDKF